MKTDIIDLILRKVDTLPSLSPVIQKIGTVMADPEVSASDIVAILKLDPVIAGKVLRLANSAYFGIPRTVSSLQNAVVILGQRRVYYLTLASGALSSFKAAGALPFDKIRFWKHSITAAMVSESIAKHIKRYEPIETEDLFCAGILHDIGKLVLGVYYPVCVSAGYLQASQTKTPFFKNEEEEVSHTKIGSMVAERWNFPPSLVQAILNHHTPVSAASFQKSVAIVHVSDIMVQLIGFNTALNEPHPPLDEQALRLIGLEVERLKVIADETIANERKVESMMDFVR